MAAPLEQPAHAGIYRRGSRYVVIWTHRGRQQKEAFRTLAEAREAKGRRQAGDKRPKSRGSVSRTTSRAGSRTTPGGPPGDSRRRPVLEYRRPIEAHVLPPWQTWRLADCGATAT